MTQIVFKPLPLIRTQQGEMLDLFVTAIIFNHGLTFSSKFKGEPDQSLSYSLLLCLYSSGSGEGGH